MFYDQELVDIAGDNSATQRGHVSFQLDTDPEAMTLILIPGTVAYVKDNLFLKKNQNTPTQTAFALVKFCSKRRSRVTQDLTICHHNVGRQMVKLQSTYTQRR